MANNIIRPRSLLLVEIERRCGDPSCNSRVFIGLTKLEARAYTGFVCERCERWTEDNLSERDIPEWWEELKLTSLEGLRPLDKKGLSIDEPAEAVSRLSDAWRHMDTPRENGGDKSDEN
jgi:hypothetical protein